MQAKLTPHELVRLGGVFKYVRMADDTLRFISVGFFTPEHREMVETGETAKSAGAVCVMPSDGRRPPDASVVMKGSMTLKLPTLEDDERAIVRALWPEEAA